MNLIETIAFYATLVSFEGQKEADRFLHDNADKTLHVHIKSCVDETGRIVNTKGRRFFLEDYEGVPKLSDRSE